MPHTHNFNREELIKKGFRKFPVSCSYVISICTSVNISSKIK